MAKYCSYLLIYGIFLIICLNCDNKKINDSETDENEEDPAIITDIEGNEYHTVRIGSQLWTVEDLRTTKYNDGTPIPLVTGDTAWKYCTFGAYCSYFHSVNLDTIKKYGLLYNWYAVNTGRLAPIGWRVPSINDWNKLRHYLIANNYNWDSSSNDNKIAKALASQTDWKFCDSIGTIGNDLSLNNKSGFSALPGGQRYANSVFGNRGLMCHWWSTTPAGHPWVQSIFLSFDKDSIAVHNMQKTKGFVVRIIKN